MSAWFDELAAFLRIPSVSADPAREEDVTRAGEWVCEFVRGAGGECELVDWHGQPLVIGELRASYDPANAPTVLCYGHFDVQPPDPVELWDSPPFEPEVRGDYLYGRGVADDKGQLYLLLSGARGLAQARELRVNVRFICDGEEETGGDSIVEFLEADERGAEVAVIFDSGMIRRGLPAFNVATRGVAYFHVTVRTGVRDLHSGLYGGAALNAAHALIQALGAVVAVDGRLVDPLRNGIQAPTQEELESWRGLPAGADVRGTGSRHKWDRERIAPPCQDRAAGRGPRERIDPTGAGSAGRRDCSCIQPPPARCGAPRRGARSAAAVPAPPGVVAPDAGAVQLGLDAFERVLGVRPALIRSGGTLPVLSALADNGIATILTGFSLPNANIHSPNECLLVEYVPLGIAAARALFQEFASL